MQSADGGPTTVNLLLIHAVVLSGRLTKFRLDLFQPLTYGHSHCADINTEPPNRATGNQGATMRTNRRATQRKLIKTGAAAGIPGDLRRRLGLWVADRRREVGMTQKEMAAKIGVEDANGLSAIENGRANIPIERYTTYAKALEMTKADFAKIVLRHTDPWIYQAVYNSREQDLLDELKLIDKSTEDRGAKPDDNK